MNGFPTLIMINYIISINFRKCGDFLKKILVLGASGLIGQALCKTLCSTYEVYGTYCTHNKHLPNTCMIKLDISNGEQISHLLETIQPDYVVSTLRGNYDQQLILHQHLADYLNEQNGRLFYLSSVSVYDAAMNRPHIESDPPYATTTYGLFKINCEKLLQEHLGDSATIIRIPIIFGKHSQRIQLLRNHHQAHKPLPVRQNFYINMLSDTLVAQQIMYLINQETEGIIHLGSKDILSHEETIARLSSILKLKGATYDITRIQEQACYMVLKSERQLLPDHLDVTAYQVLMDCESYAQKPYRIRHYHN